MGSGERWLIWVAIGGIFAGIGLVAIRARSLGDALFDLQFRVPKDPVALAGNIIVIVSALLLVLIKLHRRGNR